MSRQATVSANDNAVSEDDILKQTMTHGSLATGHSSGYPSDTAVSKVHRSGHVEVHPRNKEKSMGSNSGIGPPLKQVGIKRRKQTADKAGAAKQSEPNSSGLPQTRSHLEQTNASVKMISASASTSQAPRIKISGTSGLAQVPTLGSSSPLRSKILQKQSELKALARSCISFEKARTGR